MNVERYTTKITMPSLLALAVAITMSSSVARAGTKTVTFGWEDGTSTASLGQFIPSPDTSAINYANVATGNITDFGPSGNPFPTPVDYPVTPYEGNRMLEISVVIDDETNSGSDGSVYLGIVTNLDDGDTYEFSFRSYDPTDGRSPSAPPNATFSNTADLTAFDGYAVPLQPFSNEPGTGWLQSILDEDGDATTTIVTPITFHPIDSISDAANAVRLEASLFYQSLTAVSGGGDGSEEFYIDDVSITVTSNNPNATIMLPDGTSVLVNEGLTGDHNADGSVDAADYALWRSDPASYGGDPDGYDDWVGNFGATLGSGSGLGSANIPEPASLLLVAFGVVGFGLRRGVKCR